MQKILKRFLFLSLLAGSLDTAYPIQAVQDSQQEQEEKKEIQNPSLMLVLSGYEMDEMAIGYQKEYYKTLLTSLEDTGIQACLITDGVLLNEYTEDFDSILFNIDNWLPVDLQLGWKASALHADPDPANTALVLTGGAKKEASFEPAALLEASFTDNGQDEETLSCLEDVYDHAALTAEKILSVLDFPKEEPEEKTGRPLLNTQAVSPENLETLNSNAYEIEETVQEAAACEKRYTVLVLDNSGSTDPVTIQAQKTAAAAFCQNLLDEEDVKNHIAVVSFDTGAKTLCSFTDDYSRLARKIQETGVGNLSNLSEGLQAAQSLLSRISPGNGEVEKNIIICTDGLPQTGLSSEQGSYSQEQDESYAYANAALLIDSELKNSAYIYTIGLSACMDAGRQDFARGFLYDLASEGQYYEASSPYFIEQAFEQIAGHIKTEQTGSMAMLVRPVKMEAVLSEKTLRVDDQAWIHVSFTPAAVEDVYFISKTPDIASVSANGEIKALKPGKAEFLVQAENGQSAVLTCRIYAKYDIRRLLRLV